MNLLSIGILLLGATATVWCASAHTFSFEENAGQADPSVRFVARSNGYTVFLRTGDALFSLRPSSAFLTRLVGSNPDAPLIGLEPLDTVSRYFTGSGDALTQRSVRSFGRVRHQSVYPGIDVDYYSAGGELEYDFIVAPGASPSAIRIAYEGPSSLSLDVEGELVIETPTGTITQLAPYIYQMRDGRSIRIAGEYVLENHEVGIQVSEYDARLPLIIDPILVYSTFLGGDFIDNGSAVALGSDGSIYLAGTTRSIAFPTTGAPVVGSRLGNPGGNADVFVAKFNATGTRRLYTAFLSGSFGETPTSLSVDQAGNVYVVGLTESRNFPTTPSSLTPTVTGNGIRGFVTKLNPSGMPSYSTYIDGGTEPVYVRDIAVDAAGRAFMVGSTGAPSIRGAIPRPFIGTFSSDDGFVGVLNSEGSAFDSFTYLGTAASDALYSVAIDESGNAYVAGDAGSGFPVTPGSFHQDPCPTPPSSTPLCRGTIVAKLDPSLNLIFASYLKAIRGFHSARSIAVTADAVYFAGETREPGLPVTDSAYQKQPKGSNDIFVAKITRDGSKLLFCTYFGGSEWEYPPSLSVDQFGDVYLTGYTSSKDLPVTSDAPQRAFGGGDVDFFVSKLNAQGDRLLFSTYLGGSGRDYRSQDALAPSADTNS